MKQTLFNKFYNFKMCGGKIFNSFFSSMLALTLIRSTAIAPNVRKIGEAKRGEVREHPLATGDLMGETELQHSVMSPPLFVLLILLLYEGFGDLTTLKVADTRQVFCVTMQQQP